VTARSAARAGRGFGRARGSHGHPLRRKSGFPLTLEGGLTCVPLISIGKSLDSSKPVRFRSKITRKSNESNCPASMYLEAAPLKHTHARARAHAHTHTLVSS
jgi:hypothetical protein